MRLRVFNKKSVETLSHPGLADHPYYSLSEQVRNAVFIQPLPEPFGYGYLLSGSFAKLCGFISFESMNYPYDNVFYEGVDDYREKKSEEKEVIRVLRTLACLKIDVQRLCVIIQHERWLTKELRMRGILFADDWQQFVKNDIHNFYTEIRSILDHVAMVLALRNRDAMPVSFEKLRERLQITEIRSMLENDLITLIEGCDWFSEIRDIRNQIIHHGFDSKVALEEDTNSTYFKLERPLSPRTIRLPMRFERIDGYVNFEHYSGYYCGLLLTFLNGIAKSLQARYSWDFGALYWSPESFLPMAENILHASEALESKAIQE